MRAGFAHATIAAGELLVPEGAVRRRGGGADLLGEDGMVGKLAAMSLAPESLPEPAPPALIPGTRRRRGRATVRSAVSGTVRA